MCLRPVCSSWPIWSPPASVRGTRSLQPADRQISPNSAVLFSPPKDSGLSPPSLSACLLLGTHLHQGGRAIKPALRRLPSDDTDYNSSPSTVRDESHPPVSSKNTPSIRTAANLSFLCEGREHFKILKGQAMPWT